MISAIDLMNFQGFVGRQRAELAPITLLFGPNAAGKSSIFRAIRLLQQSLLNKAPDGEFLYQGDYQKLGNLKYVIHSQNIEVNGGAGMAVGVRIPTSDEDPGALRGISEIGIRLLNRPPAPISSGETQSRAGIALAKLKDTLYNHLPQPEASHQIEILLRGDQGQEIHLSHTSGSGEWCVTEEHDIVQEFYESLISANDTFRAFHEKRYEALESIEGLIGALWSDGLPEGVHEDDFYGYGFSEYEVFKRKVLVPGSPHNVSINSTWKKFLETTLGGNRVSDIMINDARPNEDTDNYEQLTFDGPMTRELVEVAYPLMVASGKVDPKVHPLELYIHEILSEYNGGLYPRYVEIGLIDPEQISEEKFVQVIDDNFVFSPDHKIFYTPADFVMEELSKKLLLIIKDTVLRFEASVEVTLPLREIPGYSEQGPDRSSRVSKDTQLITNEWLQILTNDRFETETVTENPRSPQPQIRRQVIDNFTGARFDFRQVGVGLSQILPVIEEAFSTAPNVQKTVLIEQPELHLHPKMQSELAEMFIQANKTTGNQFVIETHSESLLLRFQKNIRLGKLDPSLLRIVYVEPASNNPTEWGNRKPDLTESEAKEQSSSNHFFNIDMDDAGDILDPFPVSFADLRIQDLLGD